MSKCEHGSTWGQRCDLCAAKSHKNGRGGWQPAKRKKAHDDR
jgi:hypothetical protein